MALRILTLATAAACLATPSLALETPAPTELEGVTVVADIEIRLTVAVGGDVGESTFVASAPAGLTCGGAQYQYMTRENRQCWLRVRRKTDVILTAQANGRYGVDWSVEWVGCEPLGNGAACRIKPLEETQVAALFTRR
ncbi:MAG: hypothetical protein ACOY4K_00925 [Pseudomonadota bacterium]